MRAERKNLILIFIVAAEIVIISLITDGIMDHGGLDLMHRFATLMMMVSQWILIATIYELGNGTEEGARMRYTNGHNARILRICTVLIMASLVMIDGGLDLFHLIMVLVLFIMDLILAIQFTFAAIREKTEGGEE